MKASRWEKDEDEAPKVEFQKNNRNHRSTAIVPANIQYRPTQPQCLATELKKKKPRTWKKLDFENAHVN